MSAIGNCRAKLLLDTRKEKVPDTSFFIDGWSTGTIRLNILLLPICIMYVFLACHRPVGFSIFFIFYFLIKLLVVENGV